eukprot:TRINITY_DN2711_c0_g4_i8.p1 TRINITY_DN2711_c0_g4~~TRINITY_DN2711_c0_g4_i8.p1  ORF type:complete len:275 (+),score=37.59 TRINITY_DN2711_c0_g4_i8:95-919(+)
MGKDMKPAKTVKAKTENSIQMPKTVSAPTKRPPKVSQIHLIEDEENGPTGKVCNHMISPQARNDKISIPGSSSSHHMQSSMLNSSVRSPSDFRTATENNIQRDDTLRTSKSPSCTEIRQPRKHGVCHKVAAQTKSVASLSSEAVPEQNGLIPVPDRSMFQIKSNADEMVFEKQRRSNVALRRNLYAEKLRSALKAVPADRLCQECNQNLRRQTHESVETCAEAEGNDSHQNFLVSNWKMNELTHFSSITYLNHQSLNRKREMLLRLIKSLRNSI